MILGPQEYFACPKCKNVTSRHSIMSGNTFGMKAYSDGYSDAPMMPTQELITKCDKCSSFFWIDEETQVEEFEYRVDFGNISQLPLKDYIETLKQKVYRNEKEEKYLRINIWWRFNDRIRDQGGKLFETEEEKELWDRNLDALLKIIQSDDVSDRLMLSEIHRENGSFDKAEKILKTVNESEYKEVKEKLLDECKKRNDHVVLISEVPLYRY